MLLKDCNTCIIIQSEAEPDARLQARVVSRNDRIKLFLKDVNRLGGHIDRIRIDFQDCQVGYIKTFCQLDIQRNTDPDVPEPWVADCKILEKVEVLQRQKDVRVKVDEEILFSSKIHGHFTGTIHNISVGGLYMTTYIRLEKGEQFDFQYCFMKKLLKVRVMVLREIVNHDNSLGYGCEFVHLSNSEEKDIRQFVFQQQRKNLHYN